MKDSKKRRIRRKIGGNQELERQISESLYLLNVLKRILTVEWLVPL